MTKNEILAQVRVLDQQLKEGKCVNPYATRNKIKSLLQKVTTYEKRNGRFEWLAQ